MNAVNELYKPKVITLEQPLAGIAAHSAIEGEQVALLDKLKITSFDDLFPSVAESLLNIAGLMGHTNDALIIIRETTMLVYTSFPFSFNVYVKDCINEGNAIFMHQIMDITSISFNDSFIDVNPLNGDRVIWLFRANWTFGLYMDLTGELKRDRFKIEAGTFYKRLVNIKYYKMLENSELINTMIADGWFPFIELINTQLDLLTHHYSTNKRVPADIKILIKTFTEERILKITNKWWQKEIFSGKKLLIESAINSYLLGNNSGYILAIKCLASEIEGIVRILYFQEMGKKATTNELKNYISKKASTKYSFDSPIFMPHKFLDYLNNYFFSQFELTNEQDSGSRHAYCHGLASNSSYSQEHALKLFLILDNIWYFI